jgi:hypothetical protein
MNDALSDAEFDLPSDPQPNYTMQWFPPDNQLLQNEKGFGHDPRQHAVALSFVIALKSGPMVRTGGEALDFAWFTLEDLEKSQRPLWPGTRHLVHALFDGRLNARTYAALSARRTARDSMLWQVPALTLAAQAFLLTIALNSATTPPARGLASGLAFLAALMGMQLLSRHTLLERQDAKWLEAAERADDEQTRIVHARPDALPADGLPWMMRKLGQITSRYLWFYGLGTFGAVALTLFIVNFTTNRHWLEGL